ncbi:hypothetical protein HELRODRAFT_173419 [Helobdella robusta]|uniref:Uncharacterized protein n=1 Tax=Helobdella robusta TaxID=6412 RepID=T1F6S8_HELRO|nr:hypothetical protein HELRODRAFT_173419 [Helobdella robusta]ESO03717.1 hypothetical protein HELRODRAFT_173419 [Helobdella robusta]
MTRFILALICFFLASMDVSLSQLSKRGRTEQNSADKSCKHHSHDMEKNHSIKFVFSWNEHPTENLKIFRPENKNKRLGTGTDGHHFYASFNKVDLHATGPGRLSGEVFRITFTLLSALILITILLTINLMVIMLCIAAITSTSTAPAHAQPQPTM